MCPRFPLLNQVVSLQVLPPEEADPALALLCPVRALRHYVDRTQSFRTSDQLFVCHGGREKGNAVSKQRMAHWIVDAITLAYQAQGVPCPFRLRAHSTRSVASSWALARGASLTDICSARPSLDESLRTGRGLGSICRDRSDPICLFPRLALEPVFPGRLPATPRGYNHLQSSICI